MAINYDLINRGGISLSANFELLSEKPLDARHVVPTFEGLQNYIDNGAAYEGMIVFVSDQKIHYRVETIEGRLSYRELNWTDEELKALIASETVEAFESAAEATATEKADRMAADEALTTILNQEVERSTTEDTRLADLIASKSSATQAELNILFSAQETETSTRIAADKAINTKLDNLLDQEKADRLAAEQLLNTVITQETTRATAEELKLESLVAQTAAAHRSECDALIEALETETANRLVAERDLSNVITAEVARATQVDNELTQELVTSVATLNKTIDDRCTAEATTRAIVIAQLTDNLNQSAADLSARLQAEATTRLETDLELDQKLKDERTAREDIVADFHQDLVLEANTARAAEENLANSLSKEVAARELKDLALTNVLTGVQSELDLVIGRDPLLDVIVDIVSIPQAEQNAKDYTDQTLKAYRTASEQAEVDGKFEERIYLLESIDHTKLAEEASAAAVATILDDAPEKFDTLKEIAAWIAEADTAEDAASLVTRVSTLEEESATDANAKKYAEEAQNAAVSTAAAYTTQELLAAFTAFLAQTPSTNPAVTVTLAQILAEYSTQQYLHDYVEEKIKSEIAAAFKVDADGTLILG